MPTNNHKAFTLIELIVVITIVAILATISFSTFQTLQTKSRDTKRKQDLKKLQTALEIYYSKYKHYPTFTKDDHSYPDKNTNWEKLFTHYPENNPDGTPRNAKVSEFINEMPHDPREDGVFHYIYHGIDSNPSSPSPDDIQSYYLCGELENNNDSDYIPAKDCAGKHSYRVVKPE